MFFSNNIDKILDHFVFGANEKSFMRASTASTTAGWKYICFCTRAIAEITSWRFFFSSNYERSAQLATPVPQMRIRDSPPEW